MSEIYPKYLSLFKSSGCKVERLLDSIASKFSGYLCSGLHLSSVCMGWFLGLGSLEGKVYFIIIFDGSNNG